jgi:hypothetical protein
MNVIAAILAAIVSGAPPAGAGGSLNIATSRLAPDVSGVRSAKCRVNCLLATIRSSRSRESAFRPRREPGVPRREIVIVAFFQYKNAMPAAISFPAWRFDAAPAAVALLFSWQDRRRGRPAWDPARPALLSVVRAYFLEENIYRACGVRLRGFKIWFRSRRSSP